MNRTLKFRAWDKEKKQMCIVNAIQFKAGLVLLVRNDGKQYAVPLSNVELLQFTYAHDKNGKEIYEGDVLRLIDSEFEEGNNYVTVEWNDKMTGFDPFIDYAMFSSSPVSGIGDDPKNCEVIGNVFENPELISSTEPSPTSNPIEAPQKSDLAPK